MKDALNNQTENNSDLLQYIEFEIKSVNTKMASFCINDFKVFSNKAKILIDLFRAKVKLQQQALSIIKNENDRLKEASERLEIDRKRLRMELRVSMGFKDKGKTAEETTSTRLRQPGKRGAPVGHSGKSRAIPDSWDSEQIIPGYATCNCGSKKVIALKEYDCKYIEDIVPARKTVTKILYQKTYCCKCGKTSRHPDVFTGPPVITGKNLAAHLAVLRQRGTTYRQLARICKDILGISLTPSGVLGVVSRTTDHMNPVYEQIATTLPEQKVIHADETGWKVRGDNYYIWVMCNRNLTYFHPDKSRSSAIPKNLLGENFRGTVNCDFYGGYNFLQKTQRCLIHLLRDIRKERKLLPANIALYNFQQRFMEFLEKGKNIQKIKNEAERNQKAESLKKELISIGKMRMPAYGKSKNLTKRILKFQEDIFRFVRDPNLEYHNNRAERQIRPLVISRKMSFGSDTAEGARRDCVLHSVIETCVLNKIKPLGFIKDILQKRKPLLLPFSSK